MLFEYHVFTLHNGCNLEIGEDTYPHILSKHTRRYYRLLNNKYTAHTYLYLMSHKFWLKWTFDRNNTLCTFFVSKICFFIGLLCFCINSWTNFNGKFSRVMMLNSRIVSIYHNFNVEHFIFDEISKLDFLKTSKSGTRLFNSRHAI